MLPKLVPIWVMTDPAVLFVVGSSSVCLQLKMRKLLLNLKQKIINKVQASMNDLTYSERIVKSRRCKFEVGFAAEH